MPALCDELGEDWTRPTVRDDEDADGAARAARSADRLLALLRSGAPARLGTVAGEIDALGAAAITAYAECSAWVIP
jgi:hypothetical protein